MRDKELPYIFRGPFKDYCLKYVEYKRSLGFKYGEAAFYTLRYMDDFFIKYHMDSASLFLTKEMVEEYVALRGNESTKTQHMRMSLIRQFALFMNRLGFDFYVYPETELVQVKSKFVPYIFTHEEIPRLIGVLDAIEFNPWSRNYHLIYPMLFRMLYGCGLRINEALSIKMYNIDLCRGYLLLEETKNSTVRLVPMSASLTQYCLWYVKQMGFSQSYDGYYYPSRDGGQYNSTPIYLQFRKFMKLAGIYKEDGKTPRVHDIRHTFAVHSLEKMVSEGRDIYCALPILSTYLGHRGIESTEKYLRMTSEAYETVLETVADFYQNVFPEVTDDEE